MTHERFLIILLWLALPFAARADVGYLRADSVSFVHAGDSVQLKFTVNFGSGKVDRDDIWLLEPRIEKAGHSIRLPSVGVYGRTPYYYFVRSGRYLFQGEDDVMLRDKETYAREPLLYIRTRAYEEWMEGARVHIDIMRLTRCGDAETYDGYHSDQIATATTATMPQPATNTRYVVRTAKGTAHVDFVLDSIWIDPDYHTNIVELKKITDLIDSLQAEPEVHIDTVTLHGYASPEGPYKHNVWLADKRVKALAAYLAMRHNLDPAIISQQSTPEDWAGLRRYVEASKLPHRDEILRVIDDTISRPDPDRRLRYIRRTYKQDFADIFDNSLPYLRHTDYTIRYTAVDAFDEPDETDAMAVWQEPEWPELLRQTPPRLLLPLRPLLAVKTNFLFDAGLWPNVEVEVPFGHDAQWSLMAEWGSPWYVWHHNSRAYEILNVGLELRRWSNKCPAWRPVLTGGFWGVYLCAGKYDIEWHSVGDQGEYLSAGLSAGYSWLLGKCLNFEVSASMGALGGPRRHYHGEFNDTHLIWKRFGNTFYVGPTQIKASIVWLLPRKWFGLDKTQKGGEL